MHKYKYLEVKKRSDVTNVFLNRGDGNNALSEGLMLELTDFSTKIRKDTKTRVVTFGAQGKNFSVGFDLNEAQSDQELLHRWKHNVGRDLMQAILNIEQITICSIHGYCLGGAAVIASACDFRIAAKNTQVGYPEIDLGMNLTWLGLPLVVNLVGISRAKKMVIGGDFYGADALLDWEFVDEVFEDSKEEKCLDKWVQKYASKPPLAAQMIKRSVNELAMTLFKGISHTDYDQFLLTNYSEDQKKAVRKFLTKTKKK